MACPIHKGPYHSMLVQVSVLLPLADSILLMCGIIFHTLPTIYKHLGRISLTGQTETKIDIRIMFYVDEIGTFSRNLFSISIFYFPMFLLLHNKQLFFDIERCLGLQTCNPYGLNEFDFFINILFSKKSWQIIRMSRGILKQGMENFQCHTKSGSVADEKKI